jgi:hypothetical protein
LPIRLIDQPGECPANAAQSESTFAYFRMDAKRSTAVLLSSPAAAERCAKGAGLDSSAAAAAQSAIAVDRCYCRNDRKHDFHQGLPP